MLNVPSNLQAGEQFKPAVVRKINDIIDYLKSQRIITDGKTIKANYGYNGISLHCPLKTSNNEELSTQFNHPWKMSIITDELGVQKLKIEDARIEIDAGTPDRIYFQGFELPLPQQEDQYYVVGYAIYDPDTADGETSINYCGGIVFMPSATTTADITNTFGFHTFIIGTLIAEQDEQQNLTYRIGQQYITSVFNVYDDMASECFGTHVLPTSYPLDGDVIQSFTGNEIVVNQGQVFLNDLGIQTVEFTQTFTTNLHKLFCLQINISNQTASIVSFSSNQWIYYQDGVYNIPIAYAGNYTYGVKIELFLYGAFHFNTGGKVLLNDTDGTADYLQNKLQFQTVLYDDLSSDEKQIYTNDKQYIKGITHDANQSSSSALGVNLYDELYWDYSAINNWNKSKDFLLNAERGKLQWQDFKSKVSSNDQKGYLEEKFEDTQGVHWTFSNNKIKANLDGIGKVKVNDTDTLDFLSSKLTASKGDINLEVNLASSSSSASSSTYMSQTIDISLNVQGTGLLFYDNGTLSVVQHPQNNAVLAWINNQFTWIELADCENACSSSSTSSNSL